MKRMLALAVVLAALAGCALDAPAPRAAGCVAPGARPMTVVQLYFGAGEVSEAAWAAFRDRVIARAFPDGFTVYDAAGQGREGLREAAKVLQAAVPRAADIAAQVAAVSDAYKAQFHQRSVGVVTFRACGAF